MDLPEVGNSACGKAVSTSNLQEALEIGKKQNCLNDK